jgi:D-sedoheptulose 7-phosphate isomerase
VKAPEQALEEFVRDSQDVQARFFATHRSAILEAAGTMAAAFRKGRKILLFGNGGSAADAQHIAAEFVGRFIPERPALPALSLASDPSVVTALGNDYGFERVFARQVEALGQPGDVAVGISTSGNSPNVLEALRVAADRGLHTMGFTGETGGQMAGLASFLFRVPSTRTPRIQETHIVLGHVLAELADRELHPAAYEDGR